MICSECNEKDFGNFLVFAKHITEFHPNHELYSWAKKTVDED